MTKPVNPKFDCGHAKNVSNSVLRKNRDGKKVWMCKECCRMRDSISNEARKRARSCVQVNPPCYLQEVWKWSQGSSVG